MPLASSIAVTTEETAIAAAARIGGPVMLSAGVPSLARNSDAGIVVPGLHGTDDVRRAFSSLRETSGDRLSAVVVQPMTTGGVEVTISIVQEQVSGPLVLFGPGQAPAGWPIAPPSSPLTNADAGTLIRSKLAADLAALREFLLRSIPDGRRPAANRRARTEPDGAQALGARIRIQAAEPDSGDSR